MSNLSAPRRSAKEFIETVFLTLTSTTCPHKQIEPDLTSEDLAYGPMMTAIGAIRDTHGNYWLSLGDSESLFACHLDTADHGEPLSVDQQFLEEKGDTFIVTGGNTILGADDKAGMTLMLWMIYNDVPGDYVFFIGEERGMIGSKKAATDIKDGDYQRMISFDRMGYDSIITQQAGTRTASDAFANALAEQLMNEGLMYKVDPTGLYTDSYAFRASIPECTNLSVGYHGQHGPTESQNLSFLIDLADAILSIDWEVLPAVRDHTIPEATYKYNAGGSYTRWKDDQRWVGSGRYDDIEGSDPLDFLVGMVRNGTVSGEDFADLVYGDPEMVLDILFYLALLAPEEMMEAIGEANVVVQQVA